MITDRNCNFAYSDKERIYVWGHFPKGLNFNAHDEIINVPQRNATLEGMNLQGITLSQDSAVAIARSIQLNFEIQDPEDSDDDSKPTRILSASTATKKDHATCVCVHAAPIYDGHLISSEDDLMTHLQEEM